MPTFVYSDLKNAAFYNSNHPEVLVHAPAGFDSARFGVVVYLHGFGNCIENVAAAEPGIHTPADPSADLISQLEQSGKSALLFLPETRFHEKSADPGRLGEPGGFARLFREVFERLSQDSALFADTSADSVESAILISHSGGYKAAAQIARFGGIYINELCLLDSLYGELEHFDQIATAFGSDYSSGKRQRRYINLFGTGGTANNSRSQAVRLRSALQPYGIPQELLYFDDSDVPLDEQTLEYPIVIKRVSTEHSDFGRTYVGTLLRTSHLPNQSLS